MNRKVMFVGLAITIALFVVLFAGLGKDPQKIESPLIGRTAPAFTLREVGTGNTVSFDSLRGRPVVINFWATWCRPCYEETPVLEAAVKQYGQNVKFLGVVFQDEEPKILQFMRETGASYPTVMDQEGKTAIAYGVGGVPETFFIDPSGKIVSKFEGPISPDEISSRIASLGVAR